MMTVAPTAMPSIEISDTNEMKWFCFLPRV